MQFSTAITALFIAAMPLVSAHNRLIVPKGRQELCHNHKATTPQCEAAEYNPNAYRTVFDHYHGIDSVLDGSHGAGLLCSGSTAVWPNGSAEQKVKAPRYNYDNWTGVTPTDHYKPGETYEFALDISAAHGGHANMFLSKPGTYSKPHKNIHDFESTPFCVAPVGMNTGRVSFPCTIPAEVPEGPYVILNIHQSTTTTETFTNCADVMFSENGSEPCGAACEPVPCTENCEGEESSSNDDDEYDVTVTVTVTSVSTVTEGGSNPTGGPNPKCTDTSNLFGGRACDGCLFVSHEGLGYCYPLTYEQCLPYIGTSDANFAEFISCN